MSVPWTIAMAPATKPSGEPVRSKICSVCGGTCESYHLNYGVSSCFSCRAFFRRAAITLRKKNKHYTTIACKGTGNCAIGPEVEKKCRRCRYEQCLKAGMKAEQVMSDEEKKVRFRKRLAEQRDEEILEAEAETRSTQKALKKISLKDSKKEKVKLTFKRKNKDNPSTGNKAEAFRSR